MNEMLPDGWEWATLGDIAKWSSGGTPKAGNPRYYGGGIPWAVIGDLNDGLVASTAAALTADGLAESSAKLVPAGALLVAMYGSIGKLGIAQRQMATNQAIAAAQVAPGIETRYVFYWLMSQRPSLLAAGQGGTQKNISQSILKPWPIPIAPLREQQRIVEELDRRFAHIDAAERTLRGVLQRLAGLTEAIAWRAVLPPTDEAPEVEGLPRVPDGWEWTTLGAVADVVGGVTKDGKRQSDPSYVDVPYLRVANVQRGYLELSEVAHIRVSPAKAAALRLLPGDILFNEGGDRDKLGRGWVWEGQFADCIHQNHVFRARLREPRLTPKFVSMVGNTFGRSWFQSAGRQTTNLASVNKSTLKSFPLPLPPTGEAEVRVAEAESQLSLVADAERQVRSSLRRCAQLRRALLDDAFNGRLVPQDPDEEPASALLARLNADSEVPRRPETQQRPRRRKKSPA